VLDQDADQNILLVTIDTLRADALSSYGGPALTPNLDRLASHGARFTFAHAHAVTTLPSHTSILTGQLPYEHGMRDNSGFRVKAGTATLATRLKALGFATGAFVGGFPLTKRFGLTPGFDVYDDQMPEMKGIGAVSMPERRADVVVARAAEWINKQQGRFFGWVHVFDPHSPYRPPDEYHRTYTAQPYYGEVAFVDHALGPLFERLGSIARPTVVIVTADHGESLGEHGEATHGMFAYEPTLHVPLIVARVIPGRREPAGTVIDVPVRHVDIAPTVLDAIGAVVDRTMAGASLRDVIRTGSSGDRPAYFESMTYHLVRGWAPLRGVLVNREKFIDLPIAELYDLQTDPSEIRNGAPQNPARLQVLSNILRTYNTAAPQRPGPEAAEAVAALRSLGYVSGNAPAKGAYTENDDPKRLVEIDRDLHTATDLFENGRRDDAIGLLERAIARRPDTADAYISLAHAYWQGGQPREAIAALERGLESGAPDRDIRIRLGLYLAESGSNATRAIALLQHMASDDVEALNGLGVAYGDAGRFDDAIQTFMRVIALDPTNGIAYQNLGSMTLRKALAARSDSDRQRDLRQAETYARQALELDPSLPDAHTTMGVILASTGRKQEAIESWTRAVALDGEQFNALYNLWSELTAAGARDEAVKYGRQFVATAPPAFFKSDIERVQTFLRSNRAR
jgi:arylsulfatase A-like enzyme/Flp pilus assembly protein TadD